MMKLNIGIFKELITRLFTSLTLMVYFRRVLQRGISHVDASIPILFNRLDLVTVQIARCFVYIISMEFETSIQQSNINNVTSNTRNEDSLAIKVQLENNQLIDRYIEHWSIKDGALGPVRLVEIWQAVWWFLYCDIIFIDISGVSWDVQDFNGWS